MSDAAERPKPKPRPVPTADQKAEWEAAFASATGKPVVDPVNAEVYGIIALCVAIIGTMATAGLFWLTPTGGLSILSIAAYTASRFARLSGQSEFGQRAARWAFWMWIALPVASLMAAGMSFMTMDYSRFIPDIQFQIPDGLL